ncbi:hypothetical protein AMTR_s00011p00137730, partial [Amborella trichopoda]
WATRQTFQYQVVRRPKKSIQLGIPRGTSFRVPTSTAVQTHMAATKAPNNGLRSEGVAHTCLTARPLSTYHPTASSGVLTRVHTLSSSPPILSTPRDKDSLSYDGYQLKPSHLATSSRIGISSSNGGSHPMFTCL